MNAYDKAHELARAIREHESFRKLSELRRIVDMDESAKNMIEDFRKRQWEFERRQLMGEAVDPEEQGQMQQLFDALQLHQVAKEYLQAEYQFSVLFQDVQRILADAVKEIVTPE